MKNQERVRSQAGFSLIGVLVSGAIMAVIGVGVAQMMQTGFKSASHIQMTGEMSSLRDTLRQRIDCGQTWARGRMNTGTAIINGADCTNTSAGPFPGNLKPVRLFDRWGQPLTGPVGNTGNFQPNANNWDGSGTYGGIWEVRAYCDLNMHSLVVRAARRGGGPGGFYIDPLTKRPLDWGNGSILFGSAGNVLCSVQAGGPPTKPPPCGPGQRIVDVDFNLQTFVCAPNPPSNPAPCPAGHRISGIDFNTNTFTCKSNTAVTNNCQWYSHGAVANNMWTMCNFNVNASDDCACPPGMALQGNDLYVCPPAFNGGANPIFNRCWCCYPD